ncbi:hypothetical protein Phum_PHUM597480 [Pediculus humanus corporis]|uniref:Uncharacterized protein n=1 Tax=Pediculus humanus subsp. corporis TaxID=121224 RepID=E0W2V5_PEDHC|nr:uncharacterized protein Phum_PHUM597480 [Pediculus humanus corporis]EEB19961.1 hypothetical protein Phum_PHUM597480 [Pediculus humanus corporis]
MFFLYILVKKRRRWWRWKSILTKRGDRLTEIFSFHTPYLPRWPKTPPPPPQPSLVHKSFLSSSAPIRRTGTTEERHGGWVSLLKIDLRPFYTPRYIGNGFDKRSAVKRLCRRLGRFLWIRLEKSGENWRTRIVWISLENSKNILEKTGEFWRTFWRRLENSGQDWRISWKNLGKN